MVSILPSTAGRLPAAQRMRGAKPGLRPVHPPVSTGAEFRSLVEVLLERQETGVVAVLRSPSQRRDRETLRSLQGTLSSQAVLGRLGQQRLGVLVNGGDELARVRDWVRTRRGEQWSLEVFGGATGKRSLRDLYKVPVPRWKRAFDCVAAVGALIALSPLMAVAALLIKLTSPGPLFFVQRRVGHGGQPFRIYKFRTMRFDAESQRAALLPLNEMDGAAFKLTDDPRITPVGKWLRRFSIDELPQLWNVLRGDMSLVGPRPLPCVDWNPVSVRDSARHDVLPGLTCIWQVSGRNRIGWSEWLRMDLFYVRKRSWRLDLRILLATIPAVLSQRGAA